METKKGARWRALLLATAAFAVCSAVWGLMAPLGPHFRQLYRLTATEVALLVAVPIVLGSLGRIPLGILADRYGGRRSFTILLVILLVPTALAGLADSYGTLLGVSFFLGLAGTAFAIGAPFVARWFPPAQQGMALGIYGMGYGGTALASFLAPRLAVGGGWPAAIWFWLPVLLGMAALFWLYGRDAPGFRGASESLAERLTVLLRHRVAWMLSLCYFLTFGGFVGLGVYLPTFLVSEYGLDLPDAGARAAGFVIVATLARPLGGTLADRRGGAPILNVVFLGVTGLAVLLALEPGMMLMTLGFLGTAALLGLGNGAVFKMVAEHFPRETGAVTGLVGAAGGLGGLLPPLVLGYSRDATGAYALGFMLVSGLALACLTINMLALPRGAKLVGPSD
jgi:NNP family nitrate/nitrite transporter-like MFS transporter